MIKPKMKSNRHNRNVSQTIRQSSHTIEPKSTEILSSYDTFITKEPYQHYKFLKGERKRINRTGTISSLISLPFNDDTMFVDQCTARNCKSIKHFLKESNKEQINNLLLPIIKSQKSEQLSNLLLMKPQKQYVLQSLANDIVNRALLSPNIHQLRSTYLIDKELRKSQQTLKKVRISVQDNRSPEEIEEAYDSVVFEDLMVIKLKKVIKEFLCAKDNKLNQIIISKEELFKTYPDVVNFYCDIALVPNFKNKLCNFENKLRLIDEYKNIIDYGICRYLNSLKIKIQKEKDERARKKTQGVEALQTAKTDKPRVNPEVIQFKEKKEQEVTYEYELFFGKTARYTHTGIAQTRVKAIVLANYQMSYIESD